MNRTLLGTLIGLGLAAVVARQLDQSQGTGVLCGYLFGASIAVLGVAWQLHTARTQPAKVMHAFVLSFLFKLGGVLMGALALRYVPEAAAVADWKSFIVAFAGAALIIMTCGSFDTLRALQRGSTQ